MVKYIVTSGGSFSSSLTWVDGVVPVAADSIILGSTAGPLTIDGGYTCSSIDMTSYRNTITFNNTLTINGNVTLPSGSFTQSGTGGFKINTTSSLRSNGATWSSAMTFNNSTSSAIVITLLDNIVLTKGINMSYSSTNTLISLMGNYSLYISGSMSYSAYCSGSASFVITSNGDTTIDNSGGYSTGCNMTINAGLKTINWIRQWGHYGGTFTYTSGVNVFGNPFYFMVGVNGISISDIVMNCSGITFPNFQVMPYYTSPPSGYTQSVTLNQQLNVSSSVFFCQGTNVTFLGSNGFSVGYISIFIDNGGYIKLSPGINYKSGIDLTDTSQYSFDCGYSSPSNKVSIQSANTTMATLMLSNNSYIAAANISTSYINCVGKTLNIFNGSVSNCINVRSFLDQSTPTGS